MQADPGDMMSAARPMARYGLTGRNSFDYLGLIQPKPCASQLKPVRVRSSSKMSA
jgi:hypothetical protein